MGSGHQLWVGVSPQETLRKYGPGRNCQKTAVLKTVLTVFFRSDCEIDNLRLCFRHAVSFMAWFL